MFNKSEIMRNAWAIRRTANVSMSVALKSAWALAKAMSAADQAGIESGWNHKTVANDWIKYGKTAPMFPAASIPTPGTSKKKSRLAMLTI